MEENLVQLLARLSGSIVKNQLRYDENKVNEASEQALKKVKKRLCQKGFDVLLGKTGGSGVADPCSTDYGANWDPFILIVDSAIQLESIGAKKSSHELKDNVEKLISKSYASIHDIVKFLLLLKGPPIEYEIESEPEFSFAFSGSDFFFKHSTSLSCDLLENESRITVKAAPKPSTFIKESMQYEVKRSLNSEFSLLDQFKDPELKETLSSVSTIPSDFLFSTATSQTNECTERGSTSTGNSHLCQRKVRYFVENVFEVGNFTLLDNFVETAVEQTMPNERVHPKEKSPKKICFDLSRIEEYEPSQILTDVITEKQTLWDLYGNQILENGEIIDQIGDVATGKSFLKEVEQLMTSHKKSFDYTEQFEQRLRQISSDSGSGSDVNASPRKQRVRKKPCRSFFESSKEMILNIWEQEYMLHQRYSPELCITMPKLNKISLPDYIQNVKYLLTGVSTSVFVYNTGRGNFSMVYGTCLEGITPESLADFSKDFLEMGTCYMTLNVAATTNGKSNHNRIVYQAYWKGLFEYLQCHYATVLAIPTTINLLALKASVKKLHVIITTIAELSKVFHSQPLPSNGGQLLTYLLAAAEKVNKSYVQNVVFGIIKTCCDVYFKSMLQTWLFQGALGMHVSDFFVVQKPEKSRDRSYYLSFFKHIDRIPSFLKGLENQIFNCGKTVHLLKLFNPDDKFCQILEQTNYPDIQLCLSEKKLKEMSHQFEDYANRVKNFCGESCTVITLKEEEKRKEELYELYVRTVQKQLLEDREIKKSKEMERLRERKAEQRRLLKEQMEFAESQKKRKRLEDEALNKKMDREINQIMERERQIIEEEKVKLQKYYQELFNSIEMRQRRAEWKKQRWLLHDKRVTFLKNDVTEPDDSENVVDNVKNINNDYVNNNETLTEEKDEQGNIVKKDLSEPVPCDARTDNLSEEALADIENKNVVLSEHPTEIKLKDLATSRNEYEKITAVTSEPQKLTSAQRNRMKVLGSEYNVICYNAEVSPIAKFPIEETVAMRNKRKILGLEFGDNIVRAASEYELALEKPFSETDKENEMLLKLESGILVEEVEMLTKKQMTEAEKNKKKILTSEYGESFGLKGREEKTEAPIDKPLTQAQINKQKILRSEFGEGSVELPKKESQSNLPKVKSVAEKNKEKIMNAEYGTFSVPNQTESYLSITQSESYLSKSKDNAPETEEDKSERKDADKLKLHLDLQSLESDQQAQEAFETPMSVDCDKFYEGGSDSESGTSYVTASGGRDDEDDITEEDCINIASPEEKEPTPKKIKNRKFLKALKRDKKLFRQSVDNYNAFFKMKKYKLDNQLELSETSAIDLKKYMQKSVVIALNTQEKLTNEALLKHFLREENLLSHFNSLRCYFFLNDGEFGRSLTQNAFRTLSKCSEPHQFFERSTLTNIVNEALNYTIHHTEPNAQNLSFKIIEMPQFLNHSSHNVLSPFELSYQVKWPMNIILTDKALSKYKIIFQFLLKLKRISWTLNENFLYLTYWYKDKRINGKILINSPHYHKIQVYRHAMVQFIITLEDYVSSNGLQLSWMNFLKDLESAENLDHLYQKHVRYVKDVLKRCFLTKHSQELLTLIHELIELGLKFHYTVKSSPWELDDGKYIHPNFQVLKATFNDFCSKTKDFMKTLRKKIATNHELRSHFLLLEKFDMKLT